MKYLQYIKEFQEDNKAGKYFVENQLKKHLETNPENQTEIEHILDYLYSTRKKFKVGYKTIKEKADKWSKKLQETSSKDNEVEGTDYEVVKKWKDFRFVKLISKQAYELEGKRMSHCVSSYYGKDDEIYSLRDKNNKPHCTISKQSEQIKGKGNGAIHPTYIKYVVEFLEHLKVDVRDSEMKNLGYINIETLLPDIKNKKDLFRGKYWNKEHVKLIGKSGKEYLSLDLLDYIDLISETNTGLKINFELPHFIKCSIDFLLSNSKKLLSKNASSGDYSTNASSGNYSTNASSGYSSKNEMTGKNSISVDAGHNGKAKGKIGCWFCLSEWKNGKPYHVEAFYIDGKKIKEDTWYMLKNKKLTPNQ